jgi:structural maintenance of chromosome 1
VLWSPLSKLSYRYDLAVSIVMGKNMDSIVVDSEKTAIDCINYMRDQRAGQATFLPLDTISVKPIQEKYRSFVKGGMPNREPTYFFR